MRKAPGRPPSGANASYDALTSSIEPLVSPVRTPRLVLAAVLSVLLVGMAACGGSDEEAQPPTTDEPTTLGTEDPTTPTAPVTSPPRRPPGPPGPTIPEDLRDAVRRWFRLLETGFATGRCQPLLDQVEEDLPSLDGISAKGGAAYGALFRGAGNGCVGRVGAARTELQRARALLPALDPDEGFDTTCRAQMLLVWAFEVYLGQRIPLDCAPARTTTAPAPSTTSSTSRAPTTTS